MKCERCGLKNPGDKHDIHECVGVLKRTIDDLQFSYDSCREKLCTAQETVEERDLLIKEAETLLLRRWDEVRRDIEGTPPGCDSMPGMKRELTEIETWLESVKD